MAYEIFPASSRVYVLSYGPFRGQKGTILKVDSIPYLDEPFCFYHVALDGTQTGIPIWFEHDEIKLVGAPASEQLVPEGDMRQNIGRAI